MDLHSKKSGFGASEDALDATISIGSKQKKRLDKNQAKRGIVRSVLKVFVFTDRLT